MTPIANHFDRATIHLDKCTHLLGLFLFIRSLRESLGAHNLNILSLRHIGGHNRLFFPRGMETTPLKGRMSLNTVYYHFTWGVLTIF